MHRGLIVGALVIALLAVASVDAVVSDQRANDIALAQARSAQPQARWQVTRKSFVPWASDIQSGAMRVTGGSGPAWVVELSAPGDSTWKHYTALVVVSAVGASVSAGQASSSNDS